MTHDLLQNTTTPLAAQRLSLNQVVDLWLHEKTKRTHSAETARAYTRRFSEFRTALRAAGLDLDSDPQLVATVAQGWADHSGRPTEIKPATFNQRLAILSSFYQTAIKRGVLATNPIYMVERRPVQAYASVKAIDVATIRERLALIDRTALIGLRDYALLGLFINTGRRSSEVNALRWSALHFDSDIVTITFARTKGGKTISDTLEAGVATALMRWLSAFYGAQIGDLPHDAPIWVSLAINSHGKRMASYGKPLNVRTLDKICAARLGVSSVHRLRHTFALSMEEAGAKLTEIRDRLGHSNSATTDKYLQTLHQAKNKHGHAIAKMFGFTDD